MTAAHVVLKSQHRGYVNVTVNVECVTGNQLVYKTLGVHYIDVLVK